MLVTYYFSSLAPESVLNLTRLGVTEAREEIKEEVQVVSKHISDLNRSCSPNPMGVGPKSLTSLIGNESRRDLRKWIDPPDPSSNLRTASDAHHKGTAAWCTEGKTFANWIASGSFLWIHGKRKYNIAASIAVSLIVTNDSRIGSWLWEDHSQVRCPPPRVANRTQIRQAP
jgi:hypothetical protein